MTSKCSIKNRALPFRGEGKYIHVIPSVYNPRPAPIPSRKPAPRPKTKRPSKARHRREVHHPPKYWTEERVKTLIELYGQGLTYADIALQMETTRDAVNSKINRLVNEKVLRPRTATDQWDQEDVDRLVELKKKGKTIGEISDILGRNKKSCYSAWRRWNDKQNSLRGFFNELADSREHD